jgi:hypothetical protein
MAAPADDALVLLRGQDLLNVATFVFHKTTLLDVIQPYIDAWPSLADVQASCQRMAITRNQGEMELIRDGAQGAEPLTDSDFQRILAIVAAMVDAAVNNRAPQLAIFIPEISLAAGSIVQESLAHHKKQQGYTSWTLGLGWEGDISGLNTVELVQAGKLHHVRLALNGRAKTTHGGLGWSNRTTFSAVLTVTVTTVDIPRLLPPRTRIPENELRRITFVGM